MNSVVKMTAALMLAGCVTAGPIAAERSNERRDPIDGDEKANAIAHYITSEIYKHRGDPQTWVRELERAAAQDSESLDLQLRLVGAYRIFKRYKRAIRVAEETVKNHPEAVEAYMWLGRLYYEDEQLDEAMTTFERAITIAPESTLAMEALAELKDEANDLVAEVELYEKLVQIAPNSAQVHRELGGSLYELGAYAEARDAFAHALDLDSASQRTRYLLAVTLIELADYDAAIHHLENFLSEMPEHPQGQVNLAMCYARKLDFARSATVLDGVVESAGVEPQHHLYRMYNLLREAGEPDASLAIAPSSVPIFGSLLKALVRKRANEPYERLLNGLDGIEGDLDLEATQYLNDLVRMFGDSSAEFLSAELEYLRAKGFASRALDTFLARTYMSVEAYEQAEPILRGIIENYETDKWTHYYLASVMEELDRTEDAATELRAALEIDPDDADVLNFLGYLFADENIHLDEAETMINRALELDPNNGFYLDSLGWVYYRQGKADEAVEYIERAILNMSRDDAILRDHLGDAYALQGDTEQALQQWRRALRLDPDIEGVAEKIRALSE